MEANEPCLGRWVHDDASGLEGLVIEGDSVWGAGTYRVIPYEGIYGEKATCPFQ